MACAVMRMFGFSYLVSNLTGGALGLLVAYYALSVISRYKKNTQDKQDE